MNERAMINGLGFQGYQAMPGINGTSIKAGAKSMLHMHHQMTGKPTDPTPAMRWGKLVHAVVLEPVEFKRNVAVFAGPKKGKAWDEFKEKHDAEWIVSQDEVSDLMAISTAVHGNQAAHRLIEQTMHEVVFSWSGTYGTAKARLDGYDDRHGGLILELKTTSAIEPRSFAKQFANLGYGLSAGWYKEGTLANAFSMITVESKPPYDVIVYSIGSDIIEAAREKACQIAMQYLCCCTARMWPGLADGHDVIPFELPAWATDGEEKDISTGTMGAGEL